MKNVANISVCDQCWNKHYGDRLPFKMVEPDEETCALCDDRHTSGIYVRVEITG